MNERVKSLLAKRSRATSQRELAAIERDAVAAARFDDRRGESPHILLRDLFGAESYVADTRIRLLGHLERLGGDAAETLWNLIEKPDDGGATLSAKAAIRLLVEVAGRGMPLDGAGMRLLSLLQRINQTHSKRALVERDGKKTYFFVPRTARPARTRKTAATEKKDIAGRSFDKEANRARAALCESIEKMLSGIDHAEAQRIMQMFRAELSDVFQTLRARVARSRDVRGQAARPMVAEACRVLAMDPPRRGERVDLSKAKTQKRRLVRAYHPDMAASGRPPDEVDSAAQRYQQVLEAYAVIEQYNQQLGGP